jgi:hypothetical protein
MGTLGYALGADTLIDLLHDSNPKIRVASQWALENISGCVRGEDSNKWLTWWESLSANADPASLSRGFSSTP